MTRNKLPPLEQSRVETDCREVGAGVLVKCHKSASPRAEMPKEDVLKRVLISSRDSFFKAF